MRGCAVVALALAAWAFAPGARAEPPSAAEARAFIEKLWPVAQARGISRPLFERATDAFIPDPEVIELASFQPEHTKAPGAYMTGLVGEARIDSGRQLAATHAELLGAIEAA